MDREYIVFRSETISKTLFSIIVFKGLGIYLLIYIISALWDKLFREQNKLDSSGIPVFCSRSTQPP